MQMSLRNVDVEMVIWITALMRCSCDGLWEIKDFFLQVIHYNTVWDEMLVRIVASYVFGEIHGKHLHLLCSITMPCSNIMQQDKSKVDVLKYG